MMDNRQFNINGQGDGMLQRALNLAFEQSSSKVCNGWVTTDKGLILLPYLSGTTNATKFPVPLTSEQTFPIVNSWLQGNRDGVFNRGRWDGNADHDGSNGYGWRLYCEDWGHIGEYRAVICAVLPVWMWYGK